MGGAPAPLGHARGALLAVSWCDRDLFGASAPAHLSPPRGGSPRQLKLLTYLPMSKAIWVFAPDGLPNPKSGPNAW